jgi:murein DD-endopeptidase MepM/ murein hydrolase activator NlpD
MSNGTSHHAPFVRSAKESGRAMPVVIALGLCAAMWMSGPGAVARAESEAAPETPADVAKIADDAAADDDDIATNGRLDQRIRAAARRDHLPTSVAEALIRILSDDVDLQRAAHPGDGFVVIPADAPTRARSGDAGVSLVSLTARGETLRFYRFTTPEGAVGYYDASGRSAKKLLVRRPMRGGTLRSAFGMHRHPILGISKLHTGVDWMARMGTPIYAAGAGTVETANRESAYGKIVRLRHRNGYTTAYAHLLAIARGIAPGVEVPQGRLIGYVGTSGLSSGPHLHYEVLVNSRFVDPMRIRLPAQQVLDGAALDDFQRERERLDAAAGQSAFHGLLAAK